MHTAKITWNPISVTKNEMDQRIKKVISSNGWQHAIRLLMKSGIPFDNLKVAEIGSGTGTFSLTLGLMGAAVTLLDFNHNVLENTRQIYNYYDCPAQFINADCLDSPQNELLETFDLVVSCGLAEHFTGEDRVKCIDYHRQLLKKGGVAYISVPNKLSPFYRWIRFFREVTGTFDIDIEVPFTAKELTMLADEAGFKDCYVIGNASLDKDLADYSRGSISVLVDMLPKGLQKNIREWKAGILNDINKTFLSEQEDIKKYCSDKLEYLKADMYKRQHNIITDNFSAGIILLAFTEA